MNERWWYCLSFSRSDRRSVCFPGLGPFWRRQSKPVVFWVPDSHWKLHISSFSLWSSPALLGSGSGRRCWIWGRMTINRYQCRAWRRGQAPGTILALQATWSFCPQCTVSLNGTFPVIMLRNSNTDFFGNHVRLPCEVNAHMVLLLLTRKTSFSFSTPIMTLVPTDKKVAMLHGHSLEACKP